MNSEIAVVLALILTLVIVAAVYGFSSLGIEEAGNSLEGFQDRSSGEGGFWSDDGQQQDSSYSTQEVREFGLPHNL